MLPVVEEVLAQPATHLLALLLVAVTWLRSRRCIGHAAVGVSYDVVVRRGEWWRCVTATFSHADLLHLGLNLLSLRGFGAIEEWSGTCYFLHVTALLCLLEPLVFLAVYHKLGRQHQSTNTLGFSGVIFGYQTLCWWQGMVLTSPVASLFHASLLFENASFAGHLAGIVAGCSVHFLRLDRWLPPALSLGLMAAALAYAAAACPSIQPRFTRRLPSALTLRCPRWLGTFRTPLPSALAIRCPRWLGTFHITRLSALAQLCSCWLGTVFLDLPSAVAATMRCPPWLGSRTKLVGGRLLRGASAAAAAQPATGTGGPVAGTAPKLGGGGSGVRRIGGVLLPVPQAKRSPSPAAAAARVGSAAASPPTPPASPSYRILRFSPQAPPSA